MNWTALATSLQNLSIAMAKHQAESSPSPIADKLTLYIIIRDDLGWPIGSVCSNAAHAAVDVIWKHRDDPTVVEYCSQGNGEQMRKVALACKSEKELVSIGENLTRDKIGHSVWKEQPENIVTAIATIPLRTKLSYLKTLRLLK